MSTEPHIIVLGNVVDGFELYGPFETLDDACTFRA